MRFAALDNAPHEVVLDPAAQRDPVSTLGSLGTALLPCQRRVRCAASSRSSSTSGTPRYPLTAAISSSARHAFEGTRWIAASATTPQCATELLDAAE